MRNYSPAKKRPISEFQDYSCKKAEERIRINSFSESGLQSSYLSSLLTGKSKMTFQRNFRFIRRLNMILESESLHMKSTNTTNTKDLTGSYPSVQEDKVSLELRKFRGRKKTITIESEESLQKIS